MAGLTLIGIGTIYLFLVAVTLFWAFSFAKVNGQEDLRYKSCVTIGTVLTTSLLIFCAVCPGLNIVTAAIWFSDASEDYGYDIQKFMDRPICFWRKQ